MDTNIAKVSKVSYLCRDNNIYNAMTRDENIIELINYFNNKKQFTRKELLDYYLLKKEELSESTMKWRISKLKKINVIQSVGKGIYIITDKTKFQPKPNNLITRINQIFLSQYDEINYCIWDSSSLHSFMVHQPFSSFHVFEVEKDIIKEVFNLFKDEGLNAFYQPNEDIIDDYLSYSKDAIIIKPLITKSPSYKVEKVKLAAIEKILVDIYCDKHIYPVFNLSEQINILENISENYIINFTKLLSYANRRNRKAEYKDFIEKNFENLI